MIEGGGGISDREETGKPDVFMLGVKQGHWVSYLSPYT